VSPDADLVYRTLVSLDTAREGQLAHELGLSHDRVREAVRELAAIGAIRRVSSTSRRTPKATGRAVWAARQPNQVVGHLHVHRPRTFRVPLPLDPTPVPAGPTPDGDVAAGHGPLDGGPAGAAQPALATRPAEAGRARSAEVLRPEPADARSAGPVDAGATRPAGAGRVATPGTGPARPADRRTENAADRRTEAADPASATRAIAGTAFGGARTAARDPDPPMDTVPGNPAAATGAERRVPAADHVSGTGTGPDVSGSGRAGHREPDPGAAGSLRPATPTQSGGRMPPAGRTPQVPAQRPWHQPPSWQSMDINAARRTSPTNEPVPDCPPPITLTPRERAIVELLAQGHTDETAARELDLSRRTVGYALGGLMSRLGVDNRFQLGLALGALRAAVPVPRRK
jgi:DNA-binding CsgD family transcriptional regulator